MWQGSYQNQTQLWLRWWDEQGNLLLIGNERAELERQRAQEARQQAQEARQQADIERQRAELAESLLEQAVPRLLGLGLNVEQVAEALSLSVDEVRQFIQ